MIVVNSGLKLAENQRFEIAARPHLAIDLLVANLSGTPCPVKAAAAEGGGQRPAFTGDVEVPDQTTLRDDDRKIRLYNIANPHAAISSRKIFRVTDMYSPARDKRKTPGAVNLCESYAEFDGIER